jgi:adenine-specific DNA-methyltransferase
MSKKNTGSYYTPNYLAEFVANRVLAHFKDRKNTLQILEPSVGDGSFIKAINKATNSNLSLELTAIEIDGNELAKAKRLWKLPNSKFAKQDFIQFTSKKKFSIILGNPPYIRKNLLESPQYENCKEIHFAENLSEKSVKNIWASFVVKSNQLLEEDGVLAFVLPSELLQVKFTEEIRIFLQAKFQRLEVFTFSNLMFECKGQDTVVLFAFKKHVEKGIFYSEIANEDQITNGQINLIKNDALITSNVKWTHHILSSEEIEFIENIGNRLSKINYYCESKPGIVTAANDYFIVNTETEEKFNLGRYTSPIIQKGLFVNGSVVFDQEDYQELVKSNHRTKILIFNDSDKETFSNEVKAYIELGEGQKLHVRYKCKLRNNWFVIPNIAKRPEGFFFKRCHHYPKILKNSAEVFVTDSAYKIEMKQPFDLNSLIYSFYNSLTLTFAELEGRYYGGGVLELTPNEFRKLPIPYVNTSEVEFQRYRKQFEKKENIEQILRNFDSTILNTTIGLCHDEIQRVQQVRQKLVNKRFRIFEEVSQSTLQVA